MIIRGRVEALRVRRSPAEFCEFMTHGSAFPDMDGGKDLDDSAVLDTRWLMEVLPRPQGRLDVRLSFV